MTFNLTLSSNDVVFVNFTNLFPGMDDVMQAVQQGLIQPFSSLQSKVNEQLHGRIIRVELEEDDDIWIYELKLIDPNNNIVRVEYDAQTLTILEIKGRGLENIIKVKQ